jgi:hypothetical protein
MKYTIVATYKLLVVGVALISPPPDDAYITYIAVKTGWENSGIGLYVLASEISVQRSLMQPGYAW